MQPASNEEEHRTELKNIEGRYSKFRDGSDEHVRALAKLPHESTIWLLVHTRNILRLSPIQNA